MIKRRQLGQPFQLFLTKGLILGLLVAIAGILLASNELGRWLEEDISLPWLFQLRGPLAAPEEVVVVSIDHVSSRQLGLANDPRKWPRALHGELVRALSEQGARVIVFDIIFEEPRELHQNNLFAEALREAGNSILFQSLKRTPINLSTPDNPEQTTATLESLTSPVAVLSRAALGLAPFPLPKVPARVNHFISFKAELGDIPTLPVVALQTYALPVYELFFAMLNQTIPEQMARFSFASLTPDQFHSDHLSSAQLSYGQLSNGLLSTGQQSRLRSQLYDMGGIHKLGQSLRQLFLRNPDLAQQLSLQLEANPQSLSAEQHQLLRSLIQSYSQPHSLYLNFYGPPRSITTLPYFQVLQADKINTLELAGKAVFVGFAENFQPQQKDGFYTVFSQAESGLDLSGVEIAATAFANLLQQNSLTASSATTDMLIYLLWAILLGLVLRPLPALLLLPAALLLGFAYHLLAYQLFSHFNYWIPLAIPLLWQMPLILTGLLLWNYLEVQRERQTIRHAFGQHLPMHIVDQLARGRRQLTSNDEKTFGIVLASDAQQYTNLAEQLPPAELHLLMNNYYAAIFGPICDAGGVISDVVGDAALATWSSSPADMSQRHQACDAALQIQASVDSFNQQHPTHSLPTRLGLHFGELIMGHVGTADHYEYRAVGDTVNTASRIEGLNKLLGTRILLSAEVLQGLQGFVTRKLGHFLLPGKQKPLSLYELVGKQALAHTDPLYNNFANAFNAFQNQQWTEALRGFEAIILLHSNDGPSQYFANLCRQYLITPPVDWDGVIRVNTK